MRSMFAILTAALLGSLATAQAQAASPDTGDMMTGSGLVCDTKEQAQRFVSLMEDNVEKTLLAVNHEAGTAHACMIATIGFVPGQKVAVVNKNGAVVHVIEVKVLAVVTALGFQPVEPKTYYSVVASKERSV